MDHDELGAQFREAQEAIGEHRRRQAQAEVAYNETLRRHSYDQTNPEVIAALWAVDKAVADVTWCQGAMLAAGEAYKGEPLDVVLARNEAHRAEVELRRRRALGGGT